MQMIIMEQFNRYVCRRALSGMATPVHETGESRHDEELTSRKLFVSSNNLVRDKMNSARADAATDKNGCASIGKDKLKFRKQVSGTVIHSWACTG